MNYNLQDAFRFQRGEMQLPVSAIQPMDDFSVRDALKSPQHRDLAERLMTMLSPELMAAVEQTKAMRSTEYIDFTGSKILSRN